MGWADRLLKPEPCGERDTRERGDSVVLLTN